MNESQKVKFSIGLALGALAGYGIAYLVAPQSGDKTKAKLKLESKKLQHKALVTTADYMNKFNYLIGREVSKEEARRLNDMRQRVADQVTNPSVKAGYLNEPVIEIDQNRVNR